MKTKMTNEKLKKMAVEMIFQLTGKKLAENNSCKTQEDSDFQIVMYYFHKINQQVQTENKLNSPKWGRWTDHLY